MQNSIAPFIEWEGFHNISISNLVSCTSFH